MYIRFIRYMNSLNGQNKIRLTENTRNVIENKLMSFKNAEENLRKSLLDLMSETNYIKLHAVC